MEDARTLWCGNLSSQITEELLYELFLQVGPVERVSIPTDKGGRKSNFGFVTFKHVDSVDYAVKLLDRTKLYGQNLLIQPRKGSNINANAPNRQPDRNPFRQEYESNNTNPFRQDYNMLLNAIGMYANNFAYNDHRRRDNEDRFRGNRGLHERHGYHDRRNSPERWRHHDDRRGRNHDSGFRRHNR